MEQTECFGTSTYKIQTPGNYPEESIQFQSCFINPLAYTDVPETAGLARSINP